MKKLISSFALLLPALASLAIQPVEEQPGRDLNPQFTMNLMGTMAKAAESTENKNSFFEGFESRDPDAYGHPSNTYMAPGWSNFSLANNSYDLITQGYWNLNWLTLSNSSALILPSNNQTTAFEGECFAYIMPDVMWGSKLPYPDLGLDYATNRPQDEWLVTPEMTPKEEEWFYFKLQFRPGWSIYNRDAKDFTGENNLLEVYVTEGDGTKDSEWTKIWSLKDYILANYTEEQLRADLITFNGIPYESIFVKVSDYVGKKVRLAFRYFGVNGQGMAIDNVSLGIPMPKPSYEIPAGFFKQQTIDPTMKDIKGEPQLLIPFGIEATWLNTSEDVMTNEWTYDAADGTSQTSDVKHLVTPAYTVGHKYTTPSLKGMFESRSAVFSTPFTSMQAGGRLSGEGKNGYNGELGIATYDYLDPQGSIAQSPSQIAFHEGMHDAWEMLLGRVTNTLEILGMGCVYPAAPMPYGFDYVDIFAQVKGDAQGKIDEKAAVVLTVFRLPEDEYTETAAVIGQAVLTGKDINELEVIEKGGYKNLRFNLEVPVVADGNILVLLSPVGFKGNDTLVFPFMRSTDEKVWGNSVVYMMVYETEENGGTYDTFYNLNAYPLSVGHFAGLTMSLGAAYSYMEAPAYAGTTIEIPATGGEYKLDIHSMFAPENWAVTDNGVTKSEWIELSAEKDATQADLYHTTLKFAANPEPDDREKEVFIAQAGSRVALKVVQAGTPASVSDIAVDNEMKVSVSGATINVDGVTGEVSVYNMTGLKVAAATAEGSVSFDASALAHGVYVVRSGKTAVKIIL